MNDWRPIATAPVDDPIIGLNRNGDEAQIWRFAASSVERWLTFHGSQPFNPTHWRPLDETAS